MRAGRPAAGALLFAVLLGVAGALLALVQAALLARAIAGADLGRAGLASLAATVVALTAVLLARPILAWLGDVMAQRISARVKSDLRRQLLANAVLLGARHPAAISPTEVVLLAGRGLDALDGFYGRYLPQAALALIVPLAVIACLVPVDWVAGLTVALTVPLVPVFMVLVGRMSEAHRARRWALLARLAHRFADVVAGLPTLRVFGAAEAQVGILRRITATYRSTTLATLRIAFLSALVLELLATISVALVAVGIGLRLAAGELSLEVGLFALILAPEAYLPLRRLGAEFHASEEGVTAAAAAFALIDARPLPALGQAPAPVPLGELRVEGVSVDQPGRGILAPAEASFSIRPGEMVALTGPSGAGKSTLLEVILGTLVPTAGRVIVTGRDGVAHDVSDLDRDAWRSQVAWVAQVPYLVPGTVEDSVQLGAPEPLRREAVEAALAAVGLGAAAGAGGVGLDQRVGEGGRGLSGGERRRVGVARALARSAPVIIADEPTAGLDEAAEAAVLAALRAATRRGAMVILVAHRPGAVAGADRVVEIRWRETSVTGEAAG